MGSRGDGVRRRPGRTAYRTVLTGLFGAAACALSYLEFLIPVTSVIPVPGFRLGLANIAVLLAFVYISPAAGWAVSALKMVLSLLLFGSGVSFIFSLCGNILAVSSITLLYYCFRKIVSFAGASAISSAAHATGQIVAAALLTGSPVTAGYYPYLMLLSVTAGFLTGMLLNLLAPAVGRLAPGKTGEEESGNRHDAGEEESWKRHDAGEGERGGESAETEKGKGGIR